MSFVLNALYTGSQWLLTAQRTTLAVPRRPPIASRTVRGDYRAHHYIDMYLLYRIFNAAEYRFYWDNATPPAEGDTSDESNATLPYTTTATFGDGSWYLVCDWFNGVIPSGFLPVGSSGERYLRIDISGGVEVGVPPRAPHDWRLELRSGGVVRVVAFYDEVGSLRADTWAIGYTTDGNDPPADAPNATQAIGANGFQMLEYDLPAQVDGTTVKVRLQTRRSTTYSENSTVQTVTADATGPTSATGGERWPGGVPRSE